MLMFVLRLNIRSFWLRFNLNYFIEFFMKRISRDECWMQTERISQDFLSSKSALSSSSSFKLKFDFQTTNLFLLSLFKGKIAYRLTKSQLCSFFHSRCCIFIFFHLQNFFYLFRWRSILFKQLFFPSISFSIQSSIETFFYLLFQSLHFFKCQFSLQWEKQKKIEQTFLILISKYMLQMF